MKAKPFIKWVGGGSMLFYILQAHPNIKSAVINDINENLTTWLNKD